MLNLSTLLDFFGNDTMLLTAIEHLGRVSTDAARSLREVLSFSFSIFVKMFQRRSYNSATRMVLINQIYFTSVQLLPLFLTVSLIFGSTLVAITVKFSLDFNLMEHLGRFLMGFVVSELSPFITVLLIALRSSSAINTEIAVMKVNNELKTLDVFNIDTINYLFLPRIISGIISIILLSGLFSIMVLFSGAFFSKLIVGMSMEAYADVLLQSATFSGIIILIIKCAAFGFFITLIPIRFGLRASHEFTSIPIAVLNGMVNVFIAIVMIEVLSLFAISIFTKFT
jgi:phospholipid/cholesterol/gamma-HCH transport system permease protein